MTFAAPRRDSFIGNDVFVIGGGPSLRGFDFSRLKGRNTIGCNAAGFLGNDVCNVLFFADHNWFSTYQERVCEFAGTVVTDCPDMRDNRPGWMYYLPRATFPGVFKDALGGGNSGSAAINLALIMGAKRVLLLGFDGALAADGSPNWHNDDIDAPNANVYPYFERAHAAIARGLEHEFPGTEVINLNPNSKIGCFPKKCPSLFL
jgi:hypothetical protein